MSIATNAESALLAYEDGFRVGVEAAAKLVEDQDWPLFRQPNVEGAIKARSWIRNAILKLKLKS